MSERIRFIENWLAGEESISTLCRASGISRKTGYKWMARYHEEGLGGLSNRSRAPHVPVNRISEEVKSLLLDARQVRPEYGPKKLIPMLQRAYPALSFPSKSAVSALYKREGLVATQKKRHRPTYYKSSDMGYYGPNALWCTDFKGDMVFGNKRRSAPLTVCDGMSRFLLGCYDLELKRSCDVRVRFIRLFREFGIPDGIRSDNGPPFASVGLCGLSALNVWWIKLGIIPVRGRPGHPADNGRLERLHGTMEREIKTHGPRAPQSHYDLFRTDYNEQRPHEGLNDKTPAQVYVKSTKQYPRKLEDPRYPDADFVERLDDRGRLWWKGGKHYLAKALERELVGIKHLGCDWVQIHFGPVVLGEIKKGKFLPKQPIARKHR